MSRSIEHRYASAVRAHDLRSTTRTNYSASDVLGAAAFASKRTPLGVALMRIFIGDGHAAREVLAILASKLVGKAYRMGPELARDDANEMARAILAWHRDGVCHPCAGHGYSLIPGTKTIGGDACHHCRGAGKVPFEPQFAADRVDLARWLLAEIEREQAMAAPATVRALMPQD